MSTALVEALKQWPRVPSRDEALAQVLQDAEYHGLAGVFFDPLVKAGVAIDTSILMREVARDIDHQAHLKALREIDSAFSAAGIVGVPLKGVLLAERLYPRPAARVTGDTDLMIREANIERAGRVLESIGYLPLTGAVEERFRREHFHLHFLHPRVLPLELHFHAYRGFGRTMPSDPLVERSSRFRDFSALLLLAPEDELVYLATHAAAHKFGRWSWLFDLKLLIDTLSEETLHAARRRASDLGFARPLALAARLLVTVMGMDAVRLAPLGALGNLRGRLAESLLTTPENAIVRAASRLVYTTALCADTRTSARWVGRELLRRGRGIVARDS